MSTVAKPYFTPEQYLAIERAAPFKSEYYRGEMFAMAGTTANHSTLSLNLSTSINQQLRGRPCQPFDSNVRVHIPANGLYTYPDISALCGEPEFKDNKNDTLLNPTLIVEVLSPSTESYDRGKKFELYRSLESLQEYVLVSQEKMLIERFVRQPSGDWLYTAVNQPEQSLRLESIQCTLVVAEVYDKVVFER